MKKPAKKATARLELDVRNPKAIAALLRAPAKSEAHPHRWQDEVIISQVSMGASVLDLGCGRGDLLGQLQTRRQARVQGVDQDAESVIACIEAGVPVIQSDLDQGLRGFKDAAFDFVVAEETLQTLHRPIRVLEEMLRVGRKTIVSFPNFGYRGVRAALLTTGRMPMTKSLPTQWYESDNIHLFTIGDFLDWVAASKVKLVAAWVLADSVVRPMREGDNLDAQEALFVLQRKGR